LGLDNIPLVEDARATWLAHQALAAAIGQLVGTAAQKGCDLGLDGLR
jgi:hypothetical protein